MFQRSPQLTWLLSLGFLFLLGCTESTDSTGTGTTPSSPNVAAKSPDAAAPGIRRIILLNNTDSPFWDAARAGIEKAAADLKLKDSGFTASMDTNQGAEEGQIEKLRQYGTQDDIAAVIISPTSATNPAIADELKKLKEKGLIIGCFDSDLDEKFRSIREFYVGTDNIKGGRVLATAAKNLKPDGGEYVQFVGFDSQQNAAAGKTCDFSAGQTPARHRHGAADRATVPSVSGPTDHFSGIITRTSDRGSTRETHAGTIGA